MTGEQSSQGEYFDLSEEQENAYTAEISEAVSRMSPNASRLDQLQNMRLYITLRRVFNAVGYDPEGLDVLVEPGIGSAPTEPAVDLAFHPPRHIGIDTYQLSLDAIAKNYPTLAAEGRSIQTEWLDASDPNDVPGFKDGRKVGAVLALNPDISDTEKAKQLDYDRFFINEAIVTQMANWRQRVRQPDGIMIVTTHYREEAEALVKHEELGKYVSLYGITGLYDDTAEIGNAYVVVLGAEERTEAGPIVWQREAYPEYDEDDRHNLKLNMFASEDDDDSDEDDEDFDE